MGGRPGVLRRPRVLRALGEIGREALVEALDGDVERGAQRLDEAFGLGGLVAALAAHRQRQADDDPLRALRADELHESGEAVTSRRALDDADRPRDRPGFVRDRNSGAGRAEVERDHLHARADVMCVLPTSNASARPSGFFPPASARLARPPPPPPIFFAASPEVTASIRRAPEPTEPSERTTKGPISAVQRTCVPPHSSREKPGISTTRTSSPYFSPKSIIAPSLRASSICVTNARTGRFSKIRSLTIRSTSARSSGLSACLLVLDEALVADLAAALGVERRLAQLREEVAALERLERADLRQHLGLLVADELRREAGPLAELRGAHLLAAAARAGALALLGHQPRERLLVDGDAALEGELARQLEGEAVRVVELECVLARDRAFAGDLLEEPQAALERLREPLLLALDDLLDLAPVLGYLGVRRRHLLGDDVRDAPEVVEADRARLLDSSADDAAQDVAAAFVRRDDAVADEKRHAAPVIREDAVGLRRFLRLAERHPALGRDPVHDRLVAVRLVDGDDALQDGRGALEAHARVDVLLRQGRDRAVGGELVLPEDEVPELEVALAAVARAALGAPAADAFAAVVEKLGVGAARPGPADRPEVVGAPEADDPLGRHADLLPEAHRGLVLAEAELRVARENGDPEAVGVDLHVLEDELPRELDRAVLEVLAEREVAEHLEEREVGAVESDIVDVRGSETLLHRRQQRRWRLLLAQEVRHQRLHAGARQERRVVPVGRDE